MSINEVNGKGILYDTLLVYSFDDLGSMVRVVDGMVFDKMVSRPRYPEGDHSRYLQQYETEPDSNELFFTIVTIDWRLTPPLVRILEERSSRSRIEYCLGALSCEVAAKTGTKVGGTPIQSEDSPVSD